MEKIFTEEEGEEEEREYLYKVKYKLEIIYSLNYSGAITGLYEIKVNSVVPMYNHALNTIEGRVTIQAYHREKDFKKK